MKEAFSLTERMRLGDDPLTDLKLMAGPEKNFLLLMKDGNIYKKALK